MNKIEVFNKKHIFRCCDGRLIKTNFMIGDVVRVINIGRRYDYYQDAFKYFNIIDKTKPTLNGIHVLHYD